MAQGITTVSVLVGEDKKELLKLNFTNQKIAVDIQRQLISQGYPDAKAQLIKEL